MAEEVLCYICEEQDVKEHMLNLRMKYTVNNTTKDDIIIGSICATCANKAYEKCGDGANNNLMDSYCLKCKRSCNRGRFLYIKHEDLKEDYHIDFLCRGCDITQKERDLARTKEYNKTEVGKQKHKRAQTKYSKKEREQREEILKRYYTKPEGLNKTITRYRYLAIKIGDIFFIQAIDYDDENTVEKSMEKGAIFIFQEKKGKSRMIWVSCTPDLYRILIRIEINLISPTYSVIVKSCVAKSKRKKLCIQTIRKLFNSEGYNIDTNPSVTKTYLHRTEVPDKDGNKIEVVVEGLANDEEKEELLEKWGKYIMINVCDYDFVKFHPHNDDDY
jgi:hypothetical protein